MKNNISKPIVVYMVAGLAFVALMFFGYGNHAKINMGEWREVGVRAPPVLTAEDKIDVEQIGAGQGTLTQAGDLIQVRISPRGQALDEMQSVLESPPPWDLWLWAGRKPDKPKGSDSTWLWANLSLGNANLRATLIGRNVGERLRVQLAEEATRYMRIPLAGAKGQTPSELRTLEPNERRLRDWPLAAFSKMGTVDVEILDTCPGHLYQREAVLTQQWRLLFLPLRARTNYLEWGAMEGRCAGKQVRLEVGPIDAHRSIGDNDIGGIYLSAWPLSYRSLRPQAQYPQEYESDAIMAEKSESRKIVRNFRGIQLTACDWLDVNGFGSQRYPRLLPKLQDAVEVFAANYATVRTKNGEFHNYFPGEECSFSSLRFSRMSPISEPGVRDLVGLSSYLDYTYGKRADQTWWYWYAPGIESPPRQLLHKATAPVQTSGNVTGSALASKAVPVTFSDIAADYGHKLGLTSDGVVWAEGINHCGQLGRNEEETQSGDWKPVSGLPRIRAIAAGPNMSAALAVDGTVWTWGHKYADYNNHGGKQCAWVKSSGAPKHFEEPPQPTPTKVEGLNDIVAIAQKYGRHGLALRRDGTVWGWGMNDCGQLGVEMPSTPMKNEFHTTAVQVEGLRDIKAIATGYRFSLALRADGKVWRWGKMDYSKRGTDITAENEKLEYARADPPWQRQQSCITETPTSADLDTPSPVPVVVVKVNNAVAIVAGWDYGLALTSDGHVWSFGGFGMQ